MRLIFKTVREELDEMLHDAKRNKKIVKKILLTQQEFDELKAEVNYPDAAIEENQYGKLRLTYMDIPIEIEKGDE